MSAWRAVGLNYIQYSTIASRLLRNSLKAEFRAEAVRRDASNIRFTPFIDGKPQKTTEPVGETKA